MQMFILLINLVLGQGGHWAPVTGFDGVMPDIGDVENVGTSVVHQHEAFSPEMSIYKVPKFPATENLDSTDSIPEMSTTTKHRRLSSDVRDTTNVFPSHIASNDSLPYERRATSQAHVFVGKKHGGGIYVDDPAFLAEWSVDAMKLTRKQLRRAGNGRVMIPFESNWMDGAHVKRLHLEIPLWASQSASHHLSNRSSDDDVHSPLNEPQKCTITDLPLMTAEVSAILDVMEEVMEIQRFRRLEQLRAPTWLRSNWYVVATVAPVLTMFLRRLSIKGYGREVIQFFVERVVSFFRERVVDPVAAM
jgi:hypothetical protein